MTARTVGGTLEFPVGSGSPCVGARVSAALYSNGELAYGTAGDRPIGSTAVLTGNDGAWSLDLEPNANITPAGTVWAITEQPPDRIATTYYIEVPDTAGPHDATDLLAEEPGALPTQALVAHTAELHAHGVATWRNVEDFGADAAGGIASAAANQTAIQAAFDAASDEGFGLFIPAKTYYIDPELYVRANTNVWCIGTLVCASNAPTFGAFIIVRPGSNVSWYGGTIDGGGALGNVDDGQPITNINGIAFGGRVTAESTGDVLQNMTVQGLRIVNCRRGSGGGSHPTWGQFSGGGKGFTCQFLLDGVLLSDIIIEQCDIPFSIEAALALEPEWPEDRVAHGIHLSNVLCRDCTTGPFLGAVKPAEVSSLDDPGYAEAMFGQTIIRGLTLDNCGNGDDPGDEYGVFTSNYMAHLDMEATVLVESNRVTLWRGNAAHSRVEINAVVDNLYDAVDLRPYSGASQSGATSAGNQFDVTVRAADSITGVLFRGDTTLTARSLVDVAFYHDTAPSLTANLSSSAAVRYRFRDMREGRTVEGSAANNASPAMGAAGYLAPLWLNGSALWVDSTGDLRIKTSAPASDTDGTVVGGQS